MTRNPDWIFVDPEDDLPAGGSNSNDDSELYRLPPSIGDGAALISKLRLRSGPLGDFARAIEELLEGLHCSETRLMLQGVEAVAMALAGILAAASQPEPTDLKTAIQRIASRPGPHRRYILDIDGEG